MLLNRGVEFNPITEVASGYAQTGRSGAVVLWCSKTYPKVTRRNLMRRVNFSIE